MIVGLNELNRRVGEYHPRCTRPDTHVDLARELHDTGVLGYKRIAKILQVPVRTVRDWIDCAYRAQPPVTFREVK